MLELYSMFALALKIRIVLKSINRLIFDWTIWHTFEKVITKFLKKYKNIIFGQNRWKAVTLRRNRNNPEKIILHFSRYVVPHLH